EGVDLFAALHRHSALTLTQKLIIGIRCCQVLSELHRQNVIHADIKPNNLRVVINGNKITLGAIDFGFSIIVPDGKQFVIDEAKGTRRYVAPEIFAKGKFSFASDIFALGNMFEANLGFAPFLYEDMISTNPSERPSLNHTMLKLVDTLAKQSALDEEALALINELKPKPVVSSLRPLPKIPEKK
ncbi:MAG TPA: protein kinase, partial [Candidatus Berkiella sp.]|nr:protein kinase [Candidatus Berkiella sp.]